MKTDAVVLEQPEKLAVTALDLTPPVAGDVVVEVESSGISTGTERLLWNGRMPSFPGMGYPLVPGYESVGRVVGAGPGAESRLGQRVFVPGARCYGPVRGLFGGAASRVVLPSSRAIEVGEVLGDDAVLLALAATAHHAIGGLDKPQPDLIVGHGVVGRLLARLAVLGGATPVVWETRAERRDGAVGYQVIDPADDARRDYRLACEASGDPKVLDSLIARLSPGGEIVLAGFYEQPVSFAFAPAFMREARLRVAAQWTEPDLVAVKALALSGHLELGGLITHRLPASRAPDAYRTAFADPSCLKMTLDWRALS